MLTVHIFVMVHCTYSYQVHCTYSYQVHLSYQIHLYSYQVHIHIKYIFIPSTSSCQVHLHAKYIFMPNTSSCQVHLCTKYTFIHCTPSRNVHLHTKYTFIPSTHSYQVHCTYSCQVHICVMYIVHIHTKNTFEPNTHSSQLHIYGTGGWHTDVGREGAYTPHGCSQCTEMAESATLPARSDKGTPPPCKLDSSKPCPIPSLQPLFVPTGWHHFFLIQSPYMFPPWIDMAVTIAYHMLECVDFSWLRVRLIFMISDALIFFTSFIFEILVSFKYLNKNIVSPLTYAYGI